MPYPSSVGSVGLWPVISASAHQRFIGGGDLQRETGERRGEGALVGRRRGVSGTAGGRSELLLSGWKKGGLMADSVFGVRPE